MIATRRQAMVGAASLLASPALGASAAAVRVEMAVAAGTIAIEVDVARAPLLVG